jgi:DNA-binding LytR/AlgR family response regulator
MSRDILIVEDDYDLALNMKEQIIRLGFTTSSVFNNGIEALEYLEIHSAHLLIVDINIQGPIDGIEFVKMVKLKWDIPVIFSTAYIEGDFFNRALATNPEGYLVKPYRMVNLKTSLMLSFSRINRTSMDVIYNTSILEVRDKGFVVFLKPRDIIMAQSDGLYTKIFTSYKTYVIPGILKNVEEKLPNDHFLRVHKSFLINTNFISSFNGKFVNVGDFTVPLRRGMFANLKQLFEK